MKTPGFLSQNPGTRMVPYRSIQLVYEFSSCYFPSHKLMAFDPSPPSRIDPKKTPQIYPGRPWQRSGSISLRAWDESVTWIHGIPLSYIILRYVYICVYIYMYVYMYIMYMCIYVYNVYVYICVYIYITLYVYMYIHNW